MLSILHFSFQAVAPILILIIVGFCARKAGLWDEHTLRKMNRVNFRLGLSTLMYCNLYQIDADMPLPGREVVFVLVMLVLLTVIGFLAAHFLTPERTRKGVLAQCAFRSNYAIIGLVLAESIAGQAGVELGTIFQLPSVLYFNFMSVLALSIYSGGESTFSVKKTLGTIAKNPMIIGLLLGALTILIRRQLPLNAAGEPVFLIKRDLPWAYNTVSMMSRIATPNALLILGGQLDPGHAGAFKKELVSGVFMRLVMAPFLAFVGAFAAEKAGLITVTPALCAMMVAAFGSPLSVSTVAMAQEAKADEKLAGQLVVWTSFLGMGTIFIMIAILRAMGRV